MYYNACIPPFDNPTTLLLDDTLIICYYYIMQRFLKRLTKEQIKTLDKQGSKWIVKHRIDLTRKLSQNTTKRSKTLDNKKETTV